MTIHAPTDKTPPFQRFLNSEGGPLFAAGSESIQRVCSSLPWAKSYGDARRY